MTRQEGESQVYVNAENEANQDPEEIELEEEVHGNETDEPKEDNVRFRQFPDRHEGILDSPEESQNKSVRFVRKPRLSREARGEPPAYPELEEEPVRFSQPRQLEEQEPTSPPEEPPDEPQKIPFLDVAVNFVLDQWKMILLGLLAFLILGLLIFIIAFFVTLNPAGHVPVAPNSTSTSTVTATTITKLQTTVTISTATTIATITTTTTLETTQRATTAGTSPPITTATTKSGPPLTAAPNSICTNDFVLIHNKCIKLISEPATHSTAFTTCSKAGASLITIKSAEENLEIGEYMRSQALKKIWLGLICNNNSTCQWDYNQGNLDSYSNFVGGSPDIAFGKCVFYVLGVEGESGQWGNGFCDDDLYPYMCEIPPTFDDTCDFNYNTYCYTKLNFQFTFTDAQDACQRDCSTLLSIHSELENHFVVSMFNTTGSLLLAGVAPSENLVIWADRTTRDYNNLKLFDMELSCIHMNFQSGDWSSALCNKPSWIVCKRRAGISC